MSKGPKLLFSFIYLEMLDSFLQFFLLFRWDRCVPNTVILLFIGTFFDIQIRDFVTIYFIPDLYDLKKDMGLITPASQRFPLLWLCSLSKNLVMQSEN